MIISFWLRREAKNGKRRASPILKRGRTEICQVPDLEPLMSCEPFAFATVVVCDDRYRPSYRRPLKRAHQSKIFSLETLRLQRSVSRSSWLVLVTKKRVLYSEWPILDSDFLLIGKKKRGTIAAYVTMRDLCSIFDVSSSLLLWCRSLPRMKAPSSH